jgi:hypothetical protein
VLSAIAVRRLGRYEWQEPLNDIIVVSPAIEVHGYRHLVNSLESNLSHLGGVPIAPFKANLSCVKIMKWRRTAEGLKPPGQPLVIPGANWSNRHWSTAREWIGDGRT